AAIQRFGRLLTGANVAVDLLHVGEAARRLRVASSGALLPVILRSGNVMKSIVDAAIEFDVDAIAMPTAGHHGVLDALRDSTTERVIRHAPCPVFALSASSPRPGCQERQRAARPRGLGFSPLAPHMPPSHH